jgi:hypothetical protein
MPDLDELTPLEKKMVWRVMDAGIDAAFATLSHEERIAALTAFEKAYHIYRRAA